MGNCAQRGQIVLSITLREQLAVVRSAATERWERKQSRGNHRSICGGEREQERKVRIARRDVSKVELAPRSDLLCKSEQSPWCRWLLRRKSYRGGELITAQHEALYAARRGIEASTQIAIVDEPDVAEIEACGAAQGEHGIAPGGV